jgi:hypothetical protein
VTDEKPEPQASLFDRDRFRKYPHMSEETFQRILKKGINPAYVLKIDPDDYVTKGVKRIWADNGVTRHRKMDDEAKKAIQSEIGYSTTYKCLILSKGPADQNRRIIAKLSGGGLWMEGLRIAILQRQVKQGISEIKAWSYGILLDMELGNDVGKWIYQNWATTLLSKSDRVL